MFGYWHLLLSIIHVVLSADWDYGHNHGPETWHHNYPNCSHREQSPIDIIEGKKEEGSEFDFEYEPRTFTLKNTGHNLQVDFSGGDLDLSDGGLHGKYELNQLHFHWGEVDNRGSEHTIGGSRFPLEMHMVHTKKKSSSTDRDHLAVLSVLFKLSSHDNPILKKILDKVNYVFQADSSKRISSFDIEDLLPENTDSFYRYEGSLTTPPCSETVIWTIFREFNFVSSSQLQKFRSLLDEHNNHIVDNFRPIQPLNGRKVETFEEDR